ncbi:ferric reductase NAD binding domain-containing protein [Fomes fomentarius]|nr:ferric reductase NAD binding domain-containing protein [Fomes fomentarius]
MPKYWLIHPIQLHSSRDPLPWNSSVLTWDEFVLSRSRWRSWYTADFDYGRTTVYFFCAGSALYALANLIFKYRQNAQTSNAVPENTSFYKRVVAASRSLGAKQLHVPMFNYYSPPLSAIAIVFGMLALFTAFTLTVRPYFWPKRMMGSPAIAIRSGWMAIGILPFLMVFATKVNPIGILTGVSHEKLQVYHRWTAWIMYVLALIHTLPFLIRSYKDGTLRPIWERTPWYWTGVAALVPQTWLVVMSWGPIRNRYYETFKKLHYVATFFFIFFLWVHCNFRLTSWDYIIATIVLYGASWLVRYGRMLYHGVHSGVTYEELPEDMVKIIIPTQIKWRAGQHFFVRFLDLGIHAASSHPFTVSTLDDLQQSEGEGGGIRIMEIYARVHGGITARLAAVAASQSLRTSYVMLDGPYGGVEGNIKTYDRVLLLAGGSGVTFLVPLLLDLVQSYDPETTKTRKVHLVWVMRTDDARSWFEEVLRNAVESSPEGLSVVVSYHITCATIIADDDASSITSGKTSSAEPLIPKHSSRPDVRSIVKEYCAKEGRLAVAGCGPEAFNYDVGSAVAECELAIVRGKSACSEIYLHQESYTW